MMETLGYLIGFLGIAMFAAGMARMATHAANHPPSAYQQQQYEAYRQQQTNDLDSLLSGVGTFFKVIFGLIGFAIFWLVIAAVVIWAWRIVF